MGETTQLAALVALLQSILELIERKTTRQIVRSILKELNPLLQEIEHYNDDLDQPREEIKTLIKEKDAAEGPECNGSQNRCCNLIFSLISSCRHWLLHRDDSVATSCDAAPEKQVLTAEDVKETLCHVREILEHLTKENLRNRFEGVQMKGSCGVPENHKFTVGLDEPLMELKMEVLRDGLSIIGLTGLGGSGKTTLATKLCWDEQVRDKFKENILFVTFSKTPKLKIIAERLFEHCGHRVPEFESDEDAVNGLGFLLRQIGESPILLVLDDVWPGSETLVEKLQFQMSDCKILVTSRVAFPRFGTPCHLKPLGHEDAITLFRHFALLEESSSNISEDLVQEVVRGCKVSPLALKVIGRSLCHQPTELWQKMVKKLSRGQSIFDSNTELLTYLQNSLDVLEDKPVIKECFMDLGLFPEDQRVPVTALIDMWAELYKLDDEGIEAMDIINKLDSMNLVNVLIARNNASDTDNYYCSHHFIMQHDLLRELAIYQSSQEPIEQRERLIIDMYENKQALFLKERQQGMIARMLSMFFQWCVKQKPQQVPARTLSISTVESCDSNLCNMQPVEAEVLILNVHTKQYSLPEFTEKMCKLKVLIVTNYGLHPSELNNMELLGSLSNLKKIRLQHISVPSFGTLKSLRKLSLYMCDMSQAFENGGIPISEAVPNLLDLSIDYCKDMLELPNGICDITPLKKLSISNCHKLSALPQQIGNLENLEVLRLRSCSDLTEIPDSIGRLSNLRLLDMSDCISLRNLPEDIGNLSNLRDLYMTSCTRCELPFSVTNLEHLKVTCDEETAASWEVFKPMLPNLQIEVPQMTVNLDWLHAR